MWFVKLQLQQHHNQPLLLLRVFWVEVASEQEEELFQDNMITVNGITKTYGSGDTAFQALKGVSFTIEDGEFVAIMGPSGSGKSTLMHILGCLDTPTSGTYLLDGKDVGKLDDERLPGIRKEKKGFVFPAVHLLPRTS